MKIISLILILSLVLVIGCTESKLDDTSIQDVVNQQIMNTLPVSGIPLAIGVQYNFDAEKSYSVKYGLHNANEEELNFRTEVLVLVSKSKEPADLSFIVDDNIQTLKANESQIYEFKVNVGTRPDTYLTGIRIINTDTNYTYFNKDFYIIVS